MNLSRAFIIVCFINILIPCCVKYIIPDARYGSFVIYIDFFVLPISLISINAAYSFKKPHRYFLILSFLSFIGLIVGNKISYYLWGKSSGMMYNPDGETMIIMKTVLFVQNAYLFLSLLIFHTTKAYMHKRKMEKL